MPITRRSAGHRFIFTVVACAAMTQLWSYQAAQTQTPTPFKVATWNVRAGKGIAAPANPQIDSNTTDCSRNASKPGGPFWKALDRIKNDPAIIVLALQEAWFCASPGNVRDYLGWAYQSGELDGVGFVAKHGTKANSHVFEQIGFKGLDGQIENKWVFGGDICVTSDCLETIRIYTSHLSGGGTGGGSATLSQITRMLDFINAQPSPRRNIVMGDFNYYVAEPVVVPCGTTSTVSPAAAMFADHDYTDAWKALRPGEFGATGMWHRPACGTPEGNLFKRIDYVYSRGIPASAIGRFGMVTPWTEDAPSDHAGLIASFGGGGEVPVPPDGSERVIYAGTNPRILTGAFQRVADSTAAGGVRLYNPNAGLPKVTVPLANPSSMAEYRFTAEAGREYHVWIRGKAADDAYYNDSIWLQFDKTIDALGNPAWRIGTASGLWAGIEDTHGAGLSDWGWNDNAYSGFGVNIRFAVSGEQILRLQPREDGISVDQIVISAQKYLTRSPGALKDDTVILPEVR